MNFQKFQLELKAENNQNSEIPQDIIQAQNNENQPEEADPQQEKFQLPVQKKKSTIKQSYMNLFKGYIGSGILALPYSFN